MSWFVIQALSKQINTKEEVKSLCYGLKVYEVRNVVLAGNSYSVEACTYLAHILNFCLYLKVDFT